MLQAILHGARDLRLETRNLPGALEPHQLLIATEVSALSTGTDLGNYLGRSEEVPGAPPYPRPVGYSNVGRVLTAGPAVSTLAPGQRVFSTRPHQSSFLAAESDLLVPVPASVSSAQASLAYLTQLGVAALRQARYEAGESVAVIGLGVIGLATVGMARALGARVTAIANSPVRLQAARAVGAHDLFLADAPPPANAYDIVILTANPWSAYRQALEIVRPHGRVAILGFPGRAEPAPDFNPLDPRWLYAKQLTLHGSGFSPRAECPPGEIRFNLRRNLEGILDAMATGALDLTPLISHRFPAARMREAYELAAAHDKSLLAAVFDWTGC